MAGAAATEVAATTEAAVAAAATGSGKPDGTRTGRLRVNSACAFDIYMNGRLVPEPEQEITLTSGINRLIAIVRGAQEDIAFGMVFLNTDGTYMNDLEFRLTMDEVEPK